jgi:hypothetical protein
VFSRSGVYLDTDLAWVLEKRGVGISMGIENILAVQLGEEQTWANGAVDTGQRAVLSVTGISADVQTTTFYGNSLYLIWYNVGQLDCFQAFTFFCKQFYNRPMMWWQLAAPPPNPLLQSSQIYLIAQPPPPDPIAGGTMTLIDSGYDPMKNYYLTFQGNFDLSIPLFKREGCGMVKRNTPNYQIRIG